MAVGIKTLQLLIYIGALLSTGKTKNELLVTAQRIMMNYNPEHRAALPFFPEPVKENKLPVLARSPFEDAFDEIELLGFSVSVTPFNYLKNPWWGDVMARDLVAHHKKAVKMLAYLVSRKHVPTKMEVIISALGLMLMESSLIQSALQVIMVNISFYIEYKIKFLGFHKS